MGDEESASAVKKRFDVIAKIVPIDRTIRSIAVLKYVNGVAMVFHRPHYRDGLGPKLAHLDGHGITLT